MAPTTHTTTTQIVTVGALEPVYRLLSLPYELKLKILDFVSHVNMSA